MVVGSSQRFGVPLMYGGPHAAFIATKDAHKRTLPGRLVGVSIDATGRTAYRLTLQTREQHIRREKATSNICTAQVLLAVIAGLYAVYHGPDGLRRIARRVHRLTSILAAGLRRGEVEIVHDAFFDTITVRVPGRGDEIAARALDARINLRRVDDDTLGISLDETTTRDVVEAVWTAFGVQASVDDLDLTIEDAIPPALRRTSEFLTHPTFHRYHSETEMLRYLRRLADKDIALDRAMIPLGSCTMKLNATAEMLPVTWSEFADIHPFAPADQARGYHELVDELERCSSRSRDTTRCRCSRTQGHKVSSPGLLAIRAYHRDRGDSERDVCLIPSSAHGTNAASAAMAGLRVVVVKCDDHGNVDLDDLAGPGDRARRPTFVPDGDLPVDARCLRGRDPRHLPCRARSRRSGVSRRRQSERARRCRQAGRVRRRRVASEPAQDVLHPSRRRRPRQSGPIAVKAHLAPFLPNHPVVDDAGPSTGVGPISAAPWGSAGILPISWAYITMMGGEGLLTATQMAILSANYVARRLSPHYPILYTGQNGMVAHECIVDIRPLTKDTGVTVDDVAKRLIDYGFHAPTMSFPVAGTLMVEPTESESKAELDRFCDAMIAIEREADRVAAGEWPADDNPLHNAPHPAEDVTADDWTHPYARELAAYPAPASAPEQVLGARQPDRPGLRRPQRLLLVPPTRRLRRLTHSFEERRLHHGGGQSDVPRASMASSSPISTSGGTKASAMPCPSSGEKLPLVTTPTV